MKLENMHHSSVANLLNGLTISGPSAHPCMQFGVGMSYLSRDDVSQNRLMDGNLNIGPMQGMIGERMSKSDSGYAKQPSFMYNSANKVNPAMAKHEELTRESSVAELFARTHNRTHNTWEQYKVGFKKGRVYGHCYNPNEPFVKTSNNQKFREMIELQETELILLKAEFDRVRADLDCQLLDAHQRQQ